MKPKSEKEIQAVLRLDAAGRFRHFVKQVVDAEEVWGLWQDGWALMATDDGTQVFPLWPHRDYAELNRIDDWKDYEPRSIPLSELLDEFIPGFVERGVLAGVFPSPPGKGVPVAPGELAAALRIEEEKY